LVTSQLAMGAAITRAAQHAQLLALLAVNETERNFVDVQVTARASHAYAIDEDHDPVELPPRPRPFGTPTPYMSAGWDPRAPDNAARIEMPYIPRPRLENGEGSAEVTFASFDLRPHARFELDP
jgi:hypothetical protein